MVGCTCGISHPVVDDVPERRPIADNLDLTGIGSTTNQPVRACRSIITAVSNVCCNFYRHGILWSDGSTRYASTRCRMRNKTGLKV
jgi:hypothetical protein